MYPSLGRYKNSFNPKATNGGINGQGHSGQSGNSGHSGNAGTSGNSGNSGYLGNTGNFGNSNSGNTNDSGSHVRRLSNPYEVGRIQPKPMASHAQMQMQMGSQHRRTQSLQTNHVVNETYPSTIFGDEKGKARLARNDDANGNESDSKQSNLARPERFELESKDSDDTDNIQIRLKAFVLKELEKAVVDTDSNLCQTDVFDLKSGRNVTVMTQVQEPKRVMFLMRQVIMCAIQGNATPTGYVVEIFVEKCVGQQVKQNFPRLDWFGWSLECMQFNYYQYGMISVRKENKIAPKSKTQSDACKLDLARTGSDKSWIWLYRNGDACRSCLLEKGVVAYLQLNGFVSLQQVEAAIRTKYKINFSLDSYWLLTRVIASLNGLISLAILDIYEENCFEMKRILLNLGRCTVPQIFEEARLNYDLGHSRSQSLEQVVCKRMKSIVETNYEAATRRKIRDVSVSFLKKFYYLDRIPEVVPMKFIANGQQANQQCDVVLVCNDASDLEDVSIVLRTFREHLAFNDYKQLKFITGSNKDGKMCLGAYVNGSNQNILHLRQILNQVWAEKLDNSAANNGDLDMTNFG